MNKLAVLFSSPFIRDSYIQRYLKLVHELDGQYDVYWSFQTDNGISSQPLHDLQIRTFDYTIDDLNALDYSPVFKNLNGSEHFLDECFFSQHPEYEFYWLIEYDVVFTGNWNTLFEAFHGNDADFLSTHIALRNDENKSWECWPYTSFCKEDEPALLRWVKSFNPIHRYSHRALQFLDSYLRKDGNSGFSEVMPATALYNNGFRLEDIGGTGEFVAEGNRNCFYIQGAGIHNGTMRWRPEYLLEEIEGLQTKNKLFHPVKE